MSPRPSVLPCLRALLAGALLAGACAGAQTPPAAADGGGKDDAAYQARHRAERTRIAAERQKVERRYAEEQAACQHRFAVTDCVDKSRATRRDALADLRRQEVLMADEERRRRAGERLDQLEDKAAEHEARENAGQPQAPARQAKEPSRPAGGKLPGEKAAPVRDTAREAQNEQALRRKQQRHAEDEARRAERAAQAGEAEQRFEDKQRKAADYKARVQQRQADKPSTAKPLPPLPPS